jgi:hypothetical protein
MRLNIAVRAGKCGFAGFGVLAQHQWRHYVLGRCLSLVAWFSAPIARHGRPRHQLYPLKPAERNSVSLESASATPTVAGKRLSCRRCSIHGCRSRTRGLPSGATSRNAGSGCAGRSGQGCLLLKLGTEDRGRFGSGVQGRAHNPSIMAGSLKRIGGDRSRARLRPKGPHCGSSFLRFLFG